MQLGTAAGTHIQAPHAPGRDGERRHGALGSSRAATEFGWSATTTVAEGIRRTRLALAKQAGSEDNLPKRERP
ncbi:MAG: hypothetical protein J2P19_06955 [Pseudonocardia sp.]|nr:hypothetical protein [Pseudonocardia sp.]